MEEMAEKLLRFEIARMGAFFCHQCLSANHEHCAGHNNLENCICEKHGHDFGKAMDEAYEQGIARIRALAIR